MLSKLYLAGLIAVALSAQDRAREGPREGGMMRFHPLLAALDADHDGVISAAELDNATTALKTLDKNSDGQISMDEVRPNFGPGPGVIRPEGAESLVSTLMAFDKNGDGKISKDELPERMQGMLERGDTNKDGFLSKEEIVKMAETQQANRGRFEGRGVREGRDGGGPGAGRGRPGRMRMDPVFAALDTDRDGILSPAEIANAKASLLKLDRNGDGKLTEEEVRPNFGPGSPGGFRSRPTERQQ